ncbi:MAG: cation-translocating P-type ATPase [Candidatus Sericytochromatia bacterium]|nr:cation-translocating P-type ATPase [Candidatus Sericytochromatia bacterium]
MSEETLRLGIGGMTCAACVAAVTHTLEACNGVREARVDLITHQAHVTFEAERTNPEALADVVRAAGFEAFLPSGRSRPAGEPPTAGEERGTLARGESGPLVFSAVLAAALLMGGMREMFPFWPAPLSEGRLLAGLGLLAMAGPGRPIFAKAWAGVRHGRTSMETLVALGTLATWAYSTATVVAPQVFLKVGLHAHGYFDAVGLILFFVLLGRALESRVRRDATGAARAILELRPETAQVIDAMGEEQRVPAASLVPGQVIRLRPGDQVPADGLIREGKGWFDEAFLTGESRPVAHGPGEEVHAGSLVADGSCLVEVREAGEQTLLARMASTLEEVMAGRTSAQRLADQVVARFVPAVLGLAAFTGLVWMVVPGGGPALALISAVAVLTVACPCALGLAVPLAVAAASGRAAREGVLIRDAAVLEHMHDLSLVVFDKTGTLTEGKPTVVEVLPADEGTDFRWLALAAAAEASSEHPLARAVTAAAKEHPLPGPVTNFRAYAGDGIVATVAGHEVIVGQMAFLTARDVDMGSAPTLEDVRPTSADTLVAVAIDGKMAGMLTLRDRLRPSAAASVAALAAQGLEVAMVTGDRPESAKALASDLGIAAVHAGVRPEGKVTLLKQWQAEGRRLAMVGDGLNDAAALAQADVGVAIGEGHAGTRHAAPVTLLEADLGRLAPLVRLGRATRAVMVQNLGWALGYNMVMLPLAAGAFRPWGLWLDPRWAAAAMAASSLSVVLNASRLTRIKLQT